MFQRFVSIPNINQPVDNASRFGVLSFEDAFTRYNQLKRQSNDEDKMAFITNKGIYYYKVLSFGLDMAWATY